MPCEYPVNRINCTYECIQKKYMAHKCDIFVNFFDLAWENSVRYVENSK